ncbi:MAG: response regulator [Gemmatimonadaceae bacterium]|nr:response regulator [Gemmatimonadaceae bacterium]
METRLPRSRILVVDDNVDGATSLALLLELGGHDVSVAFNGTDALERIPVLKPHVLLLDIGLPGLSGFDICRQVRAMPEGAGMVIVALTGWGQEQDRARSREAGFDAHLVKPVGHEDLLRTLRPLLVTQPS